MPIRPDLRQYYKPPAWPAVRRRILERAGGKFDENGKYLGGARCEQCKAPDQERIVRWEGSAAWASILEWSLDPTAESRIVKIVLTVAHLNHVAGDDRDENLAALCQWCHLNLDRSSHADTRKKRKDSARPLLAGDHGP